MRTLAPILLLTGCNGPSVRPSPIEARPSSSAVPAALEQEDERAPEFAETIELVALLRYALDHSPKLAAARERALAAAERPSYAGVLPDPMLSLGWYAVPVQTRTGKQEFSLGLSQALPWPGKLSNMVEGAEKQSEQARLRAHIVERDLVFDVVSSYHQLVYLHGATRVATDLEQQALRLVELATSSGRTGQSGMPQQVRAETYLAQLQYDRVALAELIVVENERVRSLLGLPATTGLGAPARQALPELEVDLEALQARADQDNLELHLARLGVELAEIQLTRSRLDARPGFNVGVRTIMTDAVSQSGISDNGEDPVLFNLGLNLPWRRDAKRAAIRERRHEMRASVLEHGSVADFVRGEVTRAWWKVSNFARLASLYRVSLLPSAEKAALAAETLFQTGEARFEVVIESIMAWHQYQLGALRAEADHGRALAELERLLGAPLEYSPSEAAP